METNHENLKRAIARFPDYEPGEEIWEQIGEQLDAVPLQAALQQMPTYEPDEQLWDLIEKKVGKRKTNWWFPAAAAVVLAFGLGFLIVSRKNQNIIYSQETADARLQMEPGAQADEHFRQLAAYCETETPVCTSTEYRSLKAEYEKLSEASEQLQNAIGTYNTAPNLLRQYSEIEKQKTDILNEMAKMI